MTFDEMATENARKKVEKRQANTHTALILLLFSHDSIWHGIMKARSVYE